MSRLKVSVVQIKVVHTAICWLLSGCVLYTLFSGVAGTIDGWTWLAVVLVLLEILALAACRGRCPLTVLAERQGAERGSVADLFLPKWFADRLFVICGSTYVVALGLMLFRLLR